MVDPPPSSPRSSRHRGHLTLSNTPLAIHPAPPPRKSRSQGCHPTGSVVLAAVLLPASQLTLGASCMCDRPVVAYHHSCRTTHWNTLPPCQFRLSCLLTRPIPPPQKPCPVIARRSASARGRLCGSEETGRQPLAGQLIVALARFATNLLLSLSTLTKDQCLWRMDGVVGKGMDVRIDKDSFCLCPRLCGTHHQPQVAVC